MVTGLDDALGDGSKGSSGRAATMRRMLRSATAVTAVEARDSDATTEESEPGSVTDDVRALQDEPTVGALLRAFGTLLGFSVTAAAARIYWTLRFRRR